MWIDSAIHVTRLRAAAVLLLLLLAACSNGPVAQVHSPSPVTGGLSQGLVAYVADQGIGVLDPSSGKSMIVAPLQPGTFRVGGPVWAPAPDVAYPEIYFTVHDDRPAETRATAGVAPYDWLFRVDPFTGVVEPVAASQDSQSEGPIGLVANAHYLALTVGCCSSYEVDALDLTQPLSALKVLSRPPAQAAFFTEGAAPGGSGLLAVREFGTGSWYWLNADAGVLNPFPISLGTDDGPVAFTADGTLAAIALPDHGAVIQPISTSLPLESPSASGSAAATASPRPASPSASSGPRHVNSKLQHPDGLAWSPDGKQLLIAVNGELELYSATAADGTAPASKFLTGSNTIGVAWSAALLDKTWPMVKAGPGPQTMVDGLLEATKLPAAADTPAARPLTAVYLWQFDSTKTSPIESITDATPAILAKYPPLSAGVVFHHWAPTTTWELLGGCYRYRVVVTGSVAPTASTFGLTGNALCSSQSPSPSPSHS
jgi:hypothetical protein